MCRRLRNPVRKYLIVSILCITLIGGVFLTAFLLLAGNLKKNYQGEMKVLSGQLESKKVYVYEAKKDIKAGIKITKDLLDYTQVLSEQPRNAFITEQEIGKITLIDIKSGTEVLKTMLAEDLEDTSLRESEFNSFHLSSNLKENDMVDIRILYPNGESYVVLSKKNLKNLNLESGRCFMWLNPEELLRISGAIVDCCLHEGSALYTVKYIEPQIQEASFITYVPSPDVLEQMKEDPNAVGKAQEQLSENNRREQDRRLEKFYSSYTGEESWNNNETDKTIYNSTAQKRKMEHVFSEDDPKTKHTQNDKSEENEGYKESGEEIYYVD